MNQQRITQMAGEISEKFEKGSEIKHAIEQRVEQHKLKKRVFKQKERIFT